MQVVDTVSAHEIKNALLDPRTKAFAFFGRGDPEGDLQLLRSLSNAGLRAVVTVIGGAESAPARRRTPILLPRVAPVAARDG